MKLLERSIYLSYCIEIYYETDDVQFVFFGKQELQESPSWPSGFAAEPTREQTNTLLRLLASPRPGAILFVRGSRKQTWSRYQRGSKIHHAMQKMPAVVSSAVAQEALIIRTGAPIQLTTYLTSSHIFKDHLLHTTPKS